MLKSLDLRNNQITNLPSEVNELKNLRRLSIQGNSLLEIPVLAGLKDTLKIFEY